jgi:hypothetical protein
MFSGIITHYLCIVAVSVIPPSPKMESLPDSVIEYDSAGTIQSLNRMYYNKDGWVDSGVGINMQTNKKEPLVFSYTHAGDTLVQTGKYNGVALTEKSKYVFDQTGLLQMELDYYRDTLEAVYKYSYNTARKMTKESILYIKANIGGCDSVIYAYDNENHLLSSTEYYSNLNCYYMEFQHDAQGRVTQEIGYTGISKTQFDRKIVYIYFHSPVLPRLAEAPKRPGIRTDATGSVHWFDPSAIRECRIVDARGVNHKKTQIDNRALSASTDRATKFYFIKATANNGVVSTGKAIPLK